MELWAHRKRLPLGDGFVGECKAPGCAGRKPTDKELKDACNMGYAKSCPHLPQEREADAVHFSAREQGERIHVQFVMVKQQAPAANGVLEFGTNCSQWRLEHPNPVVQRMAECYLEAWLGQRGRSLPR